MKRPRPLVVDSEDDSDVSQKPARSEKKKPKVKRFTRDATKDTTQLWHLIPEHYYFFEENMPKDWHIKNKDPRIYTLDDLTKEDITTLLYPIEVKISKGELVEMENWQDLEDFIEERGIAPARGIKTKEDSVQDNTERGPENTTFSTTLLTVPSQAICSDMASSPRSHGEVHTEHGSENVTVSTTLLTVPSQVICSDMVSSSRSHSDAHSEDTISVGNEDRAPHWHRNSQMVGAMAADITISQQSRKLALQSKFLKEMQQYVSLAPDASELESNNRGLQLQLAGFVYSVQQSLDEYYGALREQTGLDTPKSNFPLDSNCGGRQARTSETGVEETRVGVLSATKSLPVGEGIVNVSKNTQKALPFHRKPGLGDNLNKQTRKEPSPAVTSKKTAGSGAASEDNTADSSGVAGPSKFRSLNTGLMCAFCRNAPTKARLTQCLHVVCHKCYSDALDEAYDKTHKHPICPICGLYISKNPVPYE